MTTEELRLRQFERNPDFEFLSSKDRYLLKAKQTELHIGLIGCGTIGLEHIRIAGIDERAQISGLFDINPTIASYAAEYTRNRFRYSPKIYSDLGSLLADSTLDGFIICTPNYTHLAVFKEVARTTKPIYLEKPMAHALPDAIELYHLGIQHPAPINIGLQYRYKPQYVELLNDVEADKIGKPLHIQCTENRPPFLDKVGQWNKYNQLSGGTLIEKCCHYFHLIQHVAKQSPTRISCFANQSHNFLHFNPTAPADAIDSAHVNIEFEGGVLAHLSLCMFAPSFYEELTICGSRGKLKATEEDNPITDSTHICSIERLQPEDGVSSISHPSYGKLIRESGHHGSTYKAHQKFVEQMHVFKAKQYNAIETKATQTAALTEALWSVLIGHAAQVSAETGTVLSIQDLLEEHDLQCLTQEP